MSNNHLTEISKKSLKRYSKAAETSLSDEIANGPSNSPSSDRKIQNRMKGLDAAKKKIREDYDLEDGIAAMLDTNRVTFGDVIDALMAQKAEEAVNAKREEMAQTVFDFDAREEFEDETEEAESAEEGDESEEAELGEETDVSDESEETEDLDEGRLTPGEPRPILFGKRMKMPNSYTRSPDARKHYERKLRSGMRKLTADQAGSAKNAINSYRGKPSSRGPKGD